MNGEYWVTGTLRPWRPNAGQLNDRGQYIGFEPKRCCNGDTCVNSEAYTVCMDCGKCLPDAPKQFVFYMNNYDAGQEGCSFFKRDSKRNSGVQLPAKRRYYQSKIHFMTHLKRYLDLVTSGDPVPAGLIRELDVDVNDEMAYFHVRDLLKKRKLGKHYKDIFTIIYQRGGVRPDLSGAQLEMVERHIKSIQTFFYANRHRWRKKSMPCVPWLLERLLIACGHKPYYCLHMLKSEPLQKEAENFYDAYVAETEFIK